LSDLVPHIKLDGVELREGGDAAAGPGTLELVADERVGTESVGHVKVDALAEDLHMDIIGTRPTQLHCVEEIVAVLSL